MQPCMGLTADNLHGIMLQTDEDQYPECDFLLATVESGFVWYALVH
jgi:hypothetical protein